ncbi:putative helicase, Zinc finger, RING-type, Zinc finger, RING/FYVE/PHD-type [Septoria linicola]|nr:putative helicase, Zinc finger, RING-type, Zinc finger, RING/FYVE/PHD-type [Septoria linicola]
MARPRARPRRGRGGMGVTPRRYGSVAGQTPEPEEPPPRLTPSGRKYALATVQSAQVKSADESSIVVEAGGFTPARWFLEHGSQMKQNAEERPTKRQKLQHDDEDSKVEQSELVPLFEVAIDFYFPDSGKAKLPSSAAVEQDVDFTNLPALSVVPYGIATDHAGTSMRIALPETGGSVLLLECSEVEKEVTDLLRAIALPGQLRSSAAKGRAKDHPATVLSCTLARSTGPLYTVLRLTASLGWRSSVSAFPAGSPVGAAKIYPDYDILLQAFPDAERESFDHSQPFDPQDFYESVHVPAKDDTSHGDAFDGLLETELYPFQKRAVSWMLRREGVAALDNRECGRFYKPVRDVDGALCFVNHLQGIVTRELPSEESPLSGGILAEEMGLGKTVELLALISSNTWSRVDAGKVHDNSTGVDVSPSRSTLIVTPPSLTAQWKSELARHAPELNVYKYEGIPTGHKKAASEEETIRLLCEDYDVVITTYTTLGKEVHFAEDPPDRSMRQARKFERKRSPLVLIQWHRVVLDEAQLVESGVTSAARVACRLPRVHSWAVSGTPLKKDVQDLLGLLIFLHYKPFSDDGKLWSHLLLNHRHLFRGIFGEIALRHTKANIREELRLPPQKRVVITVPFSVVEQQYYTTLFNKMCDDVGLTNAGSPREDDWNPDDPATVERMRSWLIRLRQTCLHPQVGGRNRKALGRGKKPLRTVAEVLEVMIDQNETALRTAERGLITAGLQRAHILGNNGSDDHRAEKAVEVYRWAMSATENMAKDARAKLASAKVQSANGPALSSDSESEDSASESNPLIGRLKHALKNALQLQHQCVFFSATAYFQIKTNEVLTIVDSDQFKELESQEMALYETAKVLRKEILKGTYRKANGLMLQVKNMDAKGTSLTKVKDLQSFGGIESRRIAEKSDELLDVIREIGHTIHEWRSKIAEFLLKPLVDEDEGVETTGDEYEDSTKLQDELYIYMDAYKAICADLNTFITGETAPLIDHEIKTLLKKAKFNLNPKNLLSEHYTDVTSPEIIVDLFEKRTKIRHRQKEVANIRGLIQEARSLESAMEWDNAGRAVAELGIVKQHISDLQSVHTQYNKALIALEKDVELFRITQNQRLEYYRQLQELSDDVSPHKDKLDDNIDQDALGVAMDREEEASTVVAQLKTKSRFLLTLRKDDAGESGPRTCIICTSTFEKGVLTVCGHQFCKECLSHWLAHRRNCPMCKRNLTSNDIHDITFRPQELRAQEEVQSGEDSQPSGPSSISTSIYSDVDSAALDQIKAVDLPTSYGSKIDTLGRHLLWIREHDPGAKSIIFSQYREFLDVLGTALRDFKIGYSRLGRSGAVEKFRNEANIDCLLLDAKTDSSGLTLVNATHVFICEPLVQTAVELQAIARVHRIGQTRPTSVWMYLINDTVEEAIYELSVARRMTHVQSRQKQSSRSATPAPLAEHAIDAANSEELQSAPLSKLLVAGKGGGEVVNKDDLWQCLFGKKSEMVQNSAVIDATINRHLRASAAEERAVVAGAQQ